MDPTIPRDRALQEITSNFSGNEIESGNLNKNPLGRREIPKALEIFLSRFVPPLHLNHR